MVWNNRYIDIDENGMVVTAKNTPTENSIDTIDMVEPEQPTDAIYALYYNETDGLHWVKTGDFPEEEATEEELYQAEMLLMQAEILEKLNAMGV